MKRRQTPSLFPQRHQPMRKRNAPTKPTTPVALPVAATVYKKKPDRAAPHQKSGARASKQRVPFRLLPVAPRFRRRYPAISATATRCRRRRSRREDRYRCRRQINWTCKTRACATCGCGVPEALFCQDSASFVAHVCDLRALLRFWGVSANC
jgi:hypothetical protein